MGFNVVELQVPIKIGDKWDAKFPVYTREEYIVPVESTRKAYNASGDTFPASGGSGTAGAIMKGDLFPISVAGTLGGTAVLEGDQVLALVNTPGSTVANWQVVVKTAVDVTTDSWILTFKEGDTNIIELSTTNGKITLDNVNEIIASIPAADTAQLTPRKVYGELKNLSTNKTLFGMKTSITGSSNE
jgi:hypothetical protein